MKNKLKIFKATSILLVAIVGLLGCIKQKIQPGIYTNVHLTNSTTPNFVLYLGNLRQDSSYHDSITELANGNFLISNITWQDVTLPSAGIEYITITNDTVGTYPGASKTAGAGNSYYAAGPYMYNLYKDIVVSGSVVITKHANHLVSGTINLVLSSTPLAAGNFTGSFTNVHVKN